MHLLVVRHAIAESREDFARGGRDDRERPLSKKGRSRFERGARGLATMLDAPVVVVSSPLTRARQTADLLAAAFGDRPRRAQSDALVPGAHPRELAAWLLAELGEGAAEGDATVAAVGHEPHLSHLVSWLAAGSERSWIRVKKGSATLLHLPGRPAPGAATLLWSLAPRQLRRLEDGQLGGGGPAS